MLLLLCSLLFVAEGSAAAVHNHMHACCLEKQFEATLMGSGGTVSNGIPKAFDGTTKLYFDYDNKRIRTDTVDVDGNMTMSITMYGMHKAYSVDANGHCASASVPGPMPSNCIPDNATFLGHNAFGSYNHNIDTHTWEFDIPGITVRLTVSTNDCTPIIETIMFQNANTNYLMNYLFAEYDPKMLDPHSFDVPQACQGL